MANTKRDSKYWLARIEKMHPTVFADWQAGAFPSVNDARRAAGLFSSRTRLHEIKNAWSKASVSEKRAFLIWAGAKKRPTSPIVSVASATLTGPITVDRYLQPSATDRINTIKRLRDLTTGDVMVEIGFKAMNPSLGYALRGGSRLQPDVIAALEKWLAANSAV